MTSGDPTLERTLQIALGSDGPPHHPVRQINGPSWQTQIQQLKTVGLAAKPVVLVPNGPAPVPLPSQGVPEVVSITNTSRKILPNGNVQIAVHFTRNAQDQSFQSAAIYLKQGDGQPSLVTQSFTSPATFIVPRSNAAAAVIVQATGNFGAKPLANSPARTVSLS
jgi:hypothetical protein